MIDAIQQKCKGTEIVVQGVLPVSEEFCRQRHVSVEDWNGFNLLLEQLCVDKGVRYFSFAEQMMDENGYLSADLTSDGMCHINTEGTAIWVKALRRFAVDQYMQFNVYGLSLIHIYPSIAMGTMPARRCGALLLHGEKAAAHTTRTQSTS